MSKYIISPTAKTELKEISRYLIGYSSTAARRLREKFKQRCKLLADFPEMGQKRDELEPGLRSVPAETSDRFFRRDRS